MQGLSLPLIIRRLNLEDEGETAREEASARLEIYRAALARIEEIEKSNDESPRMLEQLKNDFQRRADGIAEIVSEGESSCRDFFKDDRNLQLDILKSEREKLIKLRDGGKLHEGRGAAHPKRPRFGRTTPAKPQSGGSRKRSKRLR